MDFKVDFLPKSQWQKTNCINRTEDYECPNESTLEAVCGRENFFARIRCCEEKACKERAKQIALTQAKAYFKALKF